MKMVCREAVKSVAGVVTRMTVLVNSASMGVRTVKGPDARASMRPANPVSPEFNSMVKE